MLFFCLDLSFIIICVAKPHKRIRVTSSFKLLKACNKSFCLKFVLFYLEFFYKKGKKLGQTFLNIQNTKIYEKLYLNFVALPKIRHG